MKLRGYSKRYLTGHSHDPKGRHSLTETYQRSSLGLRKAGAFAAMWGGIARWRRANLRRKNRFGKPLYTLWCEVSAEQKQMG